MEGGRVVSDASTAFEECAKLARSHYENFTVGSLLLPRGTKRHLHALYAFARTTDDIGDESEGDRLANLGAWEEDFHRIRRGTPRHPVNVALVVTVRQFDTPDEPFLKLIEANRIDQRKTRHETFQDLLHYCDRSANPCGRLVLYAFGVRDPESQRLADFTCTALQLVNFWQDLAIDWAKGRVYIPQEDLRRFGLGEDANAHGRADERWRALLEFECARARALLVEGAPLGHALPGRVGLEIRAVVAGGSAILDKIEAVRGDVFQHRPVLKRPDWLRIGARALCRR